MGIYLNLDKAFLEKTKAQAAQRAKKELDDDSSYLWQFDADAAIEVAADGGIIRLTSDNTPMGYITISGTLDIDAQIDMVGLIVKRLNKFKALLESLR